MKVYFYTLIALLSTNKAIHAGCCPFDTESDIIQIKNDNLRDIYEFLKNKKIEIDINNLDTYLKSLRNVAKYYGKNLEAIIDFIQSDPKERNDHKLDNDNNNIEKLLKIGIYISFDGTDIYISKDKKKLISNYETKKSIKLWEQSHMAVRDDNDECSTIKLAEPTTNDKGCSETTSKEDKNTTKLIILYYEENVEDNKKIDVGVSKYIKKY